MKRSTKVFAFVFSLFTLLIAFQNCGRAPQNVDSPLDDQVTKIENSKIDDTDDKIVLSEIQTFFLLNSEAATSPEGHEIINQIEVCRKYLGDEKRSCIWDVVIKYYALLKKSGWSVTEATNGCILAVSSSHTDSEKGLEVSATCRSETAESAPPHAIHLDECLKGSAFLSLKRARFFQHIRETVKYSKVGDKKIELFVKDFSTKPFTDACEKEHEIVSLNLFLPITVTK